MEVKWLRKALLDLDKEADYIAEDDPRSARLVVQRIFQAVESLTSNPALGRPGRITGTRELIVPKTRYIVPYRVRANRVEILRLFHSSRKLPARW